MRIRVRTYSRTHCQTRFVPRTRGGRSANSRSACVRIFAPGRESVALSRENNAQFIVRSRPFAGLAMINKRGTAHWNFREDVMPLCTICQLWCRRPRERCSRPKLPMLHPRWDTHTHARTFGCPRQLIRAWVCLCVCVCVVCPIFHVGAENAGFWRIFRWMDLSREIRKHVKWQLLRSAYVYSVRSQRLNFHLMLTKLNNTSLPANIDAAINVPNNNRIFKGDIFSSWAVLHGTHRKIRQCSSKCYLFQMFHKFIYTEICYKRVECIPNISWILVSLAVQLKILNWNIFRFAWRIKSQTSFCFDEVLEYSCKENILSKFFF